MHSEAPSHVKGTLCRLKRDTLHTKFVKKWGSMCPLCPLCPPVTTSMIVLYVANLTPSGVEEGARGVGASLAVT